MCVKVGSASLKSSGLKNSTSSVKKYKTLTLQQIGQCKQCRTRSVDQTTLDKDLQGFS